MLSEEIELLDFLSGCEVEFGVLDKDGKTLVKGFSVDAQGNAAEMPMEARDAMLMLEYGSVYIPGSFVLERCLLPAGKILDAALSEIAERILEGKETRSSIENEMRETALKIRDMARDKVRSLGYESRYISSKTGEDAQASVYAADLESLSERIDCAVKFRN